MWQVQSCSCSGDKGVQEYVNGNIRDYRRNNRNYFIVVLETDPSLALFLEERSQTATVSGIQTSATDRYNRGAIRWDPLPPMWKSRAVLRGI